MKQMIIRLDICLATRLLKGWTQPRLITFLPLSLKIRKLEP
jgi:hypothetical protein